MKKRVPWGRIILAVLAVAALAIAAPSAWVWWHLWTGCADAETKVIAVLPNAFGARGTVETDFSPEYDFTCKEALVLEHDLPDKSPDTVVEALQGLRGQLSIVDSAGEAVLEMEFSDERFCPFRTDRQATSAVPGFVFPRVAAGRYRLRLTVEEPAAPLAGLPHRVTARYALCGVEYYTLALAGGAALGAGILCLALTAGIVVVTRKKRRQGEMPDEEAVAETPVQ